MDPLADSGSMRRGLTDGREAGTGRLTIPQRFDRLAQAVPLTSRVRLLEAAVRAASYEVGDVEHVYLSRLLTEPGEADGLVADPKGVEGGLQGGGGGPGRDDDDLLIRCRQVLCGAGLLTRSGLGLDVTDRLLRSQRERTACSCFALASGSRCAAAASAAT